MPYRVAQWATGNVGTPAVRAISAHPDLELCGLIVHSDSKAGRDAGELVGIDPVGVTATTDVDAVLAEKPDCISYMATADLRPVEAIADMCRALEAGVNVVSSSFVPLVWPGHVDAALREPLEDACRRGGSSCFTNGIDPGFANDLLPLVLTSACERIDSVRIMEILNYETYNQPTVLFDTMGFGKPLDETPLLLMPGVLTLAWGGTVKLIAAGLGVELDEIREAYDREPAPESFEILPGKVDAGTMAALRFEVQGIVDGRPAIIVEHVTRLRDDLAPDWPQGSGYRITIEGSPSFTCDVKLAGDDGDHNTGGLVATAARVLNAIPAVCEAEPGVLSILDLPLPTGRHLLRSS